MSRPSADRRVKRLERSAGRLRRLARVIAPPRTENAARELRRRLLNGRTAPVEHLGRSWEEIVAPGPKPTGGARSNPGHPSRKHDLDLAVTAQATVEVPFSTRAQRRRAKRDLATTERKNRRAHARQAPRLVDTAGPSRAVLRYADRIGGESPVVHELQRAHDVRLVETRDAWEDRLRARANKFGVRYVTQDGTVIQPGEPIGGALCSCGASAQFYDQDDIDAWDATHDGCA